jgi:demethylmenaquinone methyltransferase / 2-methoxy-6-polyprenyl-1,4-benzoquinol methylase
MSFQLPTKEQKHDYCLEQFERIAKGYDLSNDVISLGMHRAWKLRAVQELIGTRDSGKFLDVCCGTGDLALTIARQLRPGSSVTGFDFAQNMLDLAKLREQKISKRQERLRAVQLKMQLKMQSKIQPQTQSKIESKIQPNNQANVQMNWVRGDAQNLPFAENTFDGAIISFGLRNLTDLQKGIDEMARVVKPGGYVINLDLGHCEMPLFAPVFSFYFSQVVPVIGGILQNDKRAYTYLPQSLTTYPRPDGISAIFQKAGLKDVVHTPLAFGTVAMHRGLKL